MKKVFLSFTLIAALVACNSSDSSTTDSASTGNTADTAAAATTTTEPAKQDITTNPDYTKGVELEAKSDCATCHKVNEKLVGPGFKEIAVKYANADDATIDALAEKIIKGGSGNWGQVPMTPHPNISKDDAKTLVKYVLLHKDA